MIFTSVVLPPPDGPMMVTNSPGLDDEVDVLENERLRLGVAEEHVSKLDAALDLPRVGERLVVSALERGQRDVRQTLQVKPEDAGNRAPSRPAGRPSQ